MVTQIRFLGVAGYEIITGKGFISSSTPTMRTYARSTAI